MPTWTAVAASVAPAAMVSAPAAPHPLPCPPPCLPNLLPSFLFDNFRLPQNHNQVFPCSSCSITSRKDTCFGFFLTLLKPLVVLPRRSALAPSSKWCCQLRLKLGHAPTFSCTWATGCDSFLISSCGENLLSTRILQYSKVVHWMCLF